MLKFLALITNKRYFKFHSVLIRLVLRLYGIKVGKHFYMEGIPSLKIRGKAENIVIGNRVSILGDIDLRNRENGTIVFENNVTIESDCRFVAARDGILKIGQQSVVTTGAIFNGGEDLVIGRNCIIGPRCSINANEHVFLKDTPVRDAGFIHAPVHIEDDCWLAANVIVMKGVTLARGSVIGAGSVVTRSTEPYSVNVGIPARKIDERK
jgi:acetyltransferase-like isoleucine patch superfamily enzyme